MKRDGITPFSSASLAELEKAIEKAVAKAVSASLVDHSLFPLSSTKRVAKLFGVSPLTVRQWVKAGLLRAHYQLVSGRTLKLLFANRDLVRFFDENFPSSADLAGSDFDPRSSRSQRIQKMLAAKRLYARRRTPRAQGAGEPQ